MSNRSLRSTWTHSDLTSAAFAVHLHVADVVSAEHDWLFFVKVTKIAAACRVTPRTAQRALRELEEAGHLTLIEDNSRTGRRTQTYRFALPDHLPQRFDPTDATGRSGITDATARADRDETGTHAAGDEPTDSSHGGGVDDPAGGVTQFPPQGRHSFRPPGNPVAPPGNPVTPGVTQFPPQGRKSCHPEHNDELNNELTTGSDFVVAEVAVVADAPLVAPSELPAAARDATSPSPHANGSHSPRSNGSRSVDAPETPDATTEATGDPFTAAGPEIDHGDQLVLIADDAVPVVDDAKDVFDAWLESRRQFVRETVAEADLARRLGSVNRSKLSPERRTLIERALAGYPKDTVIAAVTGWLHSDFHRGRNDRARIYNDLDLLLRDATKIEQFAGYHEDRDRQPVTAGSPIGRFDPANDGVIQL